MFSSITLLGLLAPLALAQIYGAGSPAATPTPAAANAAASTTTASGAGSTQTIVAAVGGPTDLNFRPNSITATPGSFVEFQFGALNHSVAESAFATPCQPLNSSTFFAGFNFAVTTGLSTSAFVLQVNDTNPIWFYCPQVLDGFVHCNLGMVGVINPPAGKTQADFVNNAKNSTLQMPLVAQGGVMATANASSTSAPSGSSSASASAASSTPSGSASHLTVGMGFMSLVGVVFSALLSF